METKKVTRHTLWRMDKKKIKIKSDPPHFMADGLRKRQKTK
jgi:hypothetical protein